MTETPADRLRRGLHWAAAALAYGFTNYRHPQRAAALRAAKDGRRLATVATTPLECVQLFNAVRACEKIPGDMAEAGVYRGGTAAVILAASSAKRLHLFDTFDGLPHSEGDFAAGEWRGSIEEVRGNLAAWSNRIEVHPGLIPHSAARLTDARFSFVHLDLDLHSSTLAALEWFWPRIAPGGMLLSHDYPLSDGVVRAFDEFFGNRSELVIPLSGNQCAAVRIS